MKSQIIHDGLMSWNDWGNYRFILPSSIEICMSGYDDDVSRDYYVPIVIETEDGEIVVRYTLGNLEEDNYVIHEEILNEILMDEIIFYLENKLYNKNNTYNENI